MMPERFIFIGIEFSVEKSPKNRGQSIPVILMFKKYYIILWMGDFVL